MLKLPPPKHGGVVVDDVVSDDDDGVSLEPAQAPPLPSSSSSPSSSLGGGRGAKKEPPAYGRRQNFLPRRCEDFGDGGAFPEIHVLQYPLNMGRPRAKSNALVSIDVDEQGQVRYDAIVRQQGANSTKIVRSSIEDIKGGESNADKVALPGAVEAEETARRTEAALMALVEGKQAKSAPTIASMGAGGKVDQAQYIRYEANPDAPGYDPRVSQRVIRMVQEQVDPMEPPRHAVQKVVRGPGSPPVPVLHSPSRKLSKEEQEEWKIPPVISNWKNNRGFTIPLDKRLAADGRNLQEHTINNKFATLAEALYITERKAAEDLRVRAQLRKQLAMKEKEDREAELREMAARARSEAASSLGNVADYNSDSDGDAPTRVKREHGAGPRGVSNLPAWMTEANAAGSGRAGDDNGDGDDHDNSKQARADVKEDQKERLESASSSSDSESDADGRRREEGYGVGESAQERERLRVQQRKERERELRQESRKGSRKRKEDRDDGRDIGEKMALGVHKGAPNLSGEGLFDSRLFNQTSGIGQGFGADDEYNQFDKPLFDRGQAAGSIYKPTSDAAAHSGANADAALSKLKDTSRFKPDVGFAGAEGGADTAGHVRSAPVQFEKSGTVQEADPFGLDAVMGNKNKRARR